jgi:hypothetical protein
MVKIAQIIPRVLQAHRVGGVHHLHPCTNTCRVLLNHDSGRPELGRQRATSGDHERGHAGSEVYHRSGGQRGFKRLVKQDKSFRCLNGRATAVEIVSTTKVDNQLLPPMRFRVRVRIKVKVEVKVRVKVKV